MTAKEYLNQYRLAKIKIEQRKKELEELKATLGYSGVELSDRVQTSPKDSLSEAIARAVDLEAEIKEEIKANLRLKHDIISQIHQLTNPLFVEILYRRYIENKNLWVISQEMNYDYGHIRHSHGYALLDFESKILKDNTQSHN